MDSVDTTQRIISFFHLPMVARGALDVIGNLEVQILHPANTGRFFLYALEAESEALAIFSIHPELHPSPKETEKSNTFTEEDSRKRLNKILIGRRVLGRSKCNF